MKLTELRGATYNPRRISKDALKGLQKSIDKFGDLSGVVFNQSRRVLISGHQRLKVVNALKERGAKIVIKTIKNLDDRGTVKTGTIQVFAGKAARPQLEVPLRVVEWSDKTQEMAANLAANQHGGEWDTDKLKKVFAALEKDKKFDIELTGFDSLFVQGLTKSVRKDKDPEERARKAGVNKLDLSQVEKSLVCICPRCKYEFDPKGKLKERASNTTKAADKAKKSKRKS